MTGICKNIALLDASLFPTGSAKLEYIVKLPEFSVHGLKTTYKGTAGNMYLTVPYAMVPKTALLNTSNHLINTIIDYALFTTRNKTSSYLSQPPKATSTTTFRPQRNPHCGRASVSFAGLTAVDSSVAARSDIDLTNLFVILYSDKIFLAL
uniref:WS_DGAT_C domain-containing protein n=1 Tax=Panagrellus redivivus TaxID=6233 RepID=A0A7E4VEX5_PANRE